ncbi:MAG: type II CAAX endopeptidase family protein [Nostocaceae cyanobacterium]|nr:type II CAAX endopeptidase family protein [Nostocaceae cyanobacterium]
MPVEVAVLIVISMSHPAAKALLSFLADSPALLQVGAFFIVWVIAWIPLVVMLSLTLKWQPSPSLLVEQKLPLVVSLYLIAPLICGIFTRLSSATFSDYGFPIHFSLLPSVGLGFGLGVLSLVLVFGMQLILGWCTWQWSNDIEKQFIGAVVPIFLVALFVGVIEELIFRGFLLTKLGQDYPLIAAAAISSVIFALLHLIWEQKETIPQLPGLWLMGMVLVLARFADGGNLGIAWGLHAGWVWAIASIDTVKLISYTGKTPQWVTGIDNKPLAGVAGITCLLLTGVILWVLLGYF